MKLKSVKAFNGAVFFQFEEGSIQLNSPQAPLIAGTEVEQVRDAVKELIQRVRIIEDADTEALRSLENLIGPPLPQRTPEEWARVLCINYASLLEMVKQINAAQRIEVTA